MIFAEMKVPGEQFEYILAVLFWRYVKQIKKELDMRKNRKNNSRTRGKRIFYPFSISPLYRKKSDKKNTIFDNFNIIQI